MDAQHSDLDCGCAPTEAEKKRLWPSVNRRSAIGIGALGALGFLTFSSLKCAPGMPTGSCRRRGFRCLDQRSFSFPPAHRTV